MLSFFKQATNHQDASKDARQNILNLVRNAISGATARIDPQLIPQILQYCNSVENSAEVLFAINEQLDHFCDMPLPVLKALKLILICLHKHYDSFFPAAQAFAPELETVLLLSFNKPSATNIKLIHQLAFQLYAHMVLNGKLPTLEFAGIEQEDINAPMPPPQPQQQMVTKKVIRGKRPASGQRGGKRPANAQGGQRPSQQQGGQNQRPAQQSQQPQRPQQQAQQQSNPEELGSLIEWDDDEPSTPSISSHPSEDFSTDLLSLDEEPPAPQPQQTEKSIIDNLPDDQKPRVPAVFAGVKAPPAREEESLLSFGDDFGFQDVPAGSAENESLLFGDFSDPINNSAQKSAGSVEVDENQFVFSDPTNTESVNEFADFNPNFDDPAPLQQKPKIPQNAPLFSKPKYTPKKKVPVANTVQQSDFNPFGNGGFPQDSGDAVQSGSGSGVFDLLSDNDVSTPVGSQDGSINVSGSGDLFDMLDSNPSVAPIASQGKSSTHDIFEPIPNSQSNSSNSYDPFGSAPAQNKPVGSSGSSNLFDMMDESPAPKASPQGSSGGNVFDMLGDTQAPGNAQAFNSFGIAPPKPATKQQETFDPFGKSSPPAQPASSNTYDPFGDFGQAKPSSGGNVFGEQPKPTQKGSNDMFTSPAPAKQGSHDFFDMYDSPPPKSSPTPAAQPQSGGDLFSMLDNPAPVKSNPPSNQGNSFGFDDFSKPAPAQNSGSVFDPFGGSSQPQQKISAASSGGLFDPFDSIPSGGSKPATQQPPPKQNQSNDIFDLF